MFNVGDLIIYSGHGVCRIDNISLKTLSGVSKHYYDLHPLSGGNLTISIPVDNTSVLMLNLIARDEAEEVIESFRLPGLSWIEKNSQRNKTYSETISTGNRKEIAKIVNTLMRRKHAVELNNKKLGAQDQSLLTSMQSILFYEMAISLDTTYEAIFDQVNQMITTYPNPLTTS